ncbi:MAG TPA: xanthine dehydrogenase family protein subunit M [Burkholderiales bacterium]|nr:xanthine dehydrogenase family protein subunit M [Burkholderiales bacterium]
MYAFEYVKARSIKEVTAFLASNPEARPLAGGMTLIPTLKARLAQPSHLVDISSLEELRGIEVQGGTISIGAGTRHNDVMRSAEVKSAIPALAELASRIGDPAVRNCGTIGGSIANNDPAADYPAAVLALNAKVITDRREIAADDYFQGMFATALAPGELIVRIAFPTPKRAAYEKFAHPASGYAMTGVFVADTANGVRVAVTGAGPGVFRWAEAEAALAKKFAVDSVAGLRMPADDLNEDIHATREYRANLVNVMTKRAVARIAGQSR